MTAAATVLRDAATADALVVNERFVSCQGEGASMGQAAVFVRLGGCNLDCSWCDSEQTWKWTRYSPGEQLTTVSVAELSRWVLAQAPTLVVITGGEPLMQQTSLLLLVRRLHEAGRRVEFETNGTIAPLPELVRVTSLFTVSPKLGGSGVRPSRRISASVLETFKGTGKAQFKFVIAGPADWEEAVALVDGHDLAPVWVMPEGTTHDAVIDGARALVARAAPRGWHVSFRLHIALGVR